MGAGVTAAGGGQGVDRPRSPGSVVSYLQSPVARLLPVLLIAALLRAYRIGRLSFWYDEVVTMRLARSDGLSALLGLLGRIDATRAPLHPLLLQGWVKVLGPSEASGRSFSALCGVLTVVLVFRLGRRAFGDDRAGLYAAWLAALSPPLLNYSREARMYAWLVLVTCAAWDALFSLRGSATAGRLCAYGAWLVALGYSHPLGLFMAGALALALLANRRALGLTRGRWLAVHAAAALVVAPWLGRYLDHPPEFTSGRLAFRFLLGTPIGFIGGNFLTLAGFSALILYGLLRLVPREGGWPRVAVDDPVAASCLLTWLVSPPVLLYTYSRVSHPVFGPTRYALFVAPAFLLLVGRGLARLPRPAGLAVAAAAAATSAAAWPRAVYAPDAKADWRSAAAALGRLDPSEREPVVVVTSSPAVNVEVVTARYYLGPRRPVLAMPARLGEVAGLLGGRGGGRVWFSVGTRGGRPVDPLPAGLPAGPRSLDFAGLRLLAIDPRDLP